MARLFVPLILLGLPIAEIAAFILVGRWIGLWPTLFLVILTSIAGAVLLRIQGFGALRRLQRSEGVDSGKQIIHGAMIVFAGLLLIIPGFITDTLGLLLFVPAARNLAWKHFKSRIIVFSAMSSSGVFRTQGRSSRKSDNNGVVDLETTEFHRNESDGPYIQKRNE